MKVDRRDPMHWLYLALFAANVVLAWMLRPFWPRSGRAVVVVYGHRLAGNLLPLHQAMAADPELRPVFLTMDPAYASRVAADGHACVLATHPRTIALLAGARAVVSDHGLHAMQWLPGRSSLRFADVWHGIPFKGFDADDFAVQRRYDEAWVASPSQRTLYVDRFGFETDRVHATGYPRTDALVEPREDIESVRDRLDLQRTRGKRVVLFAPTWRQDAAGRSVFPFGIDSGTLLGRLDDVCRRHDAMLLFRAHLNTPGEAVAGERVIAVPQSTHPDTEAVLRLADVLICDWSSIAFDYLLLDRPTLFLDVPAPFAKGFSLGPEFRFGEVVGGMDALVAALDEALGTPQAYFSRHGARHAAVRAEVYGDCADGNATARCLQRLRGLVTGGSSR